MDLLKRIKKPLLSQEAEEHKEQPIPEEDDPTIPESEKKKNSEAASVKENTPNTNISTEEKKKNEEERKRIEQEKALELKKFNNTFDKLLMEIININTKIDYTLNAVNDIKSRYDMVKEVTLDLKDNADEIADKISTISRLTEVNQELANKVDNFEIQWNLTMEPITQDELTKKLSGDLNYSRYWSELNNIIDHIYKLKVEVSKELDKQEQNPQDKKYAELYELALIMGRIFNVYPPELTHFVRLKKQNTMQWEKMKITPHQAKLLDISESQNKDEYEKRLELAKTQISEP